MDTVTEGMGAFYANETRRNDGGAGTYPRYSLIFSERATSPSGAPDVEDTIFGIMSATTVSETNAKFIAGVLSGTLQSDEWTTDLADLSAGIVIKTDRVTVKPCLVLDPTTETIAPETLGALMYDTGTDELKYYDGNWQIISAGGLSAHALDGAYHTATGLTVGWVLSADSTTTFSWKAPAAGGVHDMTGASHTEDATGGAGNVIRASGATAFAWATLEWGDLDFTTSSLADLATRTHASLSDAPADAHHVEFVSADAAALITTHTNDDNAHHEVIETADVEGIITAEIVDGESIDAAIDALILTHKNISTAHHTPPVAGDFNHNDLANIDAGDINHLTDAQVSALHAESHGQSTHTGDVIPDANQSYAGTLSMTPTDTTGSLFTITSTASLTGNMQPVVFDFSGMTLGGNNIDGLTISMPATYGAGSERAVYVSGDGRSVTLCSDTHSIETSGHVSVGGELQTGNFLTIGTIGAGTSDYDKFLVSDTGVVKFRTGAEVLSDIGAATAPLALTDLASYVQGSIIIGGGADWEALGAGTETYVLKMGAAEPAWSTVDWSELSGSQPAPISHDFDVHSGDVDLADLAAGSQGSVIRRGVSDWEEWTLGAETTVLKAGATDLTWGWVQWSEIGGSQPAPIAHVLGTSGPHTGTLPLTDLAAGTAGSLIVRGAADWEERALGGLNYVLKAAAADAVWGQVDYSELQGTQPAPVAHVLAVTGPHTGTLPWADLNKTSSSLADLATRTHASLSDAPNDAHHPKVHGLVDVINHLESGLTQGHFLKATSTTTYAFTSHGLSASDVGAYTTAEVDSAIDTDITTHTSDDNAHHEVIETADVESIITAELVDGESIDSAIDTLIGTHKGLPNDHHTPTVAGDLNHNDLANIDAGDINHLTDAQVTALHATYTNAEAIAAVVAENPLTLTYDLTISGGDINAPAGLNINAAGSINMRATSDTSDFWYFATAGDVAKIIPIDNNVHDIGTSGLRARMVYTYQLSDGTNEPTIAEIAGKAGLGDSYASEMFFAVYNASLSGTGYVLHDTNGWYMSPASANHFTARYSIPIKSLGGDGSTRTVIKQITAYVYTSVNAGRTHLYLYKADVSGAFALVGTFNPAMGGTGWRTMLYNCPDTTFLASDMLYIKIISGSTSTSAVRAHNGIKIEFTNIV